MSSRVCAISKHFDKPFSHPNNRTRSVHCGRCLAFAAGAVLFCAAGTAQSGPCTEQIAQLEQQVRHTPPGPESGPTGLQSVGAQLHRQPTPGSVEQAEHVANADADAALDRAQKADTAGNADGCMEALREAKRLYGID